MRNTTFEGAGGTAVALDQRGDRLESYDVMNYVESAASAISGVPIGRYNVTLQQYRALVLWPGNTTDVPVDYASGAFIAWSPLASVCSILCALLVTSAGYCATSVERHRVLTIVSVCTGQA